MKSKPEAMTNTKQIPKRLYRYQPFSGRTLDMIVSDTIHYSDPAAFNDPLDAKPSLDPNLKNAELVEIVRTLVEQRTRAEMSAAAKTMKVGGDKAINHIRRSSRREANRVIAEIEYNATNTDYDVEEHKRSLLRQEIEFELLRRYDRGIVALAERSDCPLMWSHYGDEHGGICIGYSVPDDAAADTHQVNYGGGRLVRASDVFAMLSDSASAHEQVDEAVLLRKAESWCYEREWRLIGPRGLHNSPLELEEITFGLKCKGSAKYITMKVLKGRERSVEFYEMREEFGTFELRKCELTYDDEMFVHFPRRHLSILELFEAVPTTFKHDAK